MILPPVTPVMPIDPTRVYELVSANTEAVKAVLFLLGFIAFAIVSSVLTVRYLAKAKTGLYSEIGGSIAMAVAVLLFIRYGASTRRTRQSHCCSLQSGTRNRTDHGADRSSRTDHAADVIYHHQTKNQKKKKEVFRYEKVFCYHLIQARFHEEQGSHLLQDCPRLDLR